MKEFFFIHDKYVFLILASNRFAKILYKLALEQGKKEGILLSIGKIGIVLEYWWGMYSLQKELKNLFFCIHDNM